MEQVYRDYSMESFTKFVFKIQEFHTGNSSSNWCCRSCPRTIRAYIQKDFLCD